MLISKACTYMLVSEVLVLKGPSALIDEGHLYLKECLYYILCACSVM